MTVVYRFILYLIVSILKVDSFCILSLYRENIASRYVVKSNSCSVYSSNVEDLSSTTENVRAKNKDANDEVMLNDIDAKVLQSLIEENSDACFREKVERLLKRKADVEVKNIKSSYWSDVLKKLDSSNSSSEGIWNSLIVKTQSMLETASIFIQNQLERDVKLVGALGLYTLERIARDTSRVLPSSSSFINEKDGSITLLKSNSDGEMSVKDKLKIPEDEIRQIWSSVKEIMSTKSAPSKEGPFLKSILSESDWKKRNKEKFERASRNRKEKTKEMPTSKVIDATYEFKRELQFEEPGYKIPSIIKTTSNAATALIGEKKQQQRQQIEASKKPQLFFVEEVEKDSSNYDFTNDSSIDIDATLVEVVQQSDTIKQETSDATNTDNSITNTPTIEIMDDEKDNDILKNARVANEVILNEEENIIKMDENKNNLATDLTLRSFDVFFYCTEKLISVGVPQIVSFSKRVGTTFINAQRDGQGSSGWSKLQNLDDAEKKY